ncbi:MAG: hypothetical protein HY826_06765 [Actinobacteria bacterium]|nr:hypothetical protein [Actinomycetota bacterium]
MNISRVLVTVSVVGASVVACSSGGESRATTSVVTSTSTSTTVAAPPTTRVPTPSTSSTSTSSTTSTTSTIPVVVGLDLSADGLGGESFGAESTGVISYVESILGAPTSDTGWLNNVSIGAACPGTEMRQVTWGDLVLTFADESPAAVGTRHFAAYSYGPPAAAFANPFGLTTDAGIGIGDTVAELLIVYPAAAVNDDEFGPTFQIEAGLFGFLTDVTVTGTITSFVGGFGCGE